MSSSIDKLEQLIKTNFHVGDIFKSKADLFAKIGLQNLGVQSLQGGKQKNKAYEIICQYMKLEFVEDGKRALQDKKTYDTWQEGLEQVFEAVLENKTFISTLNILRISGDIEDIESWFDNITFQKNSFKQLNNYLKEITILEKKLEIQTLFKQVTINKIKTYIDKIIQIINLFNNNCNYK